MTDLRTPNSQRREEVLRILSSRDPRLIREFADHPDSRDCADPVRVAVPTAIFRDLVLSSFQILWDATRCGLSLDPDTRVFNTQVRLLRDSLVHHRAKIAPDLLLEQIIGIMRSAPAQPDGSPEDSHFIGLCLFFATERGIPVSDPLVAACARILRQASCEDRERAMLEAADGSDSFAFCAGLVSTGLLLNMRYPVVQRSSRKQARKVDLVVDICQSFHGQMSLRALIGPSNNISPQDAGRHGPTSSESHMSARKSGERLSFHPEKSQLCRAAA